MRIGWMLALLLVPAVAAHGADAPRDFEQRLLSDTTSAGDYGGPESALGDGLDLLALDAFEGTVPGTAEPALVLRVSVQGGGSGEHTITIAATARGTAHALEMASTDLRSFSSEDFMAVRGPFPLGDGHAFALEGVVPLAALGIAPGDEVTGLRATTALAGEAQDVMPGTWYLAGTEVPLPPTEEADPPASYRTQGPVPMFTLAADRDLIPVGNGTRVALNITDLLGAQQTLRLSVDAPAGIDARLEQDTLALPADGTATVALDVSGIALGTVRILVESDLGSARILSLPLEADGRIGTGIDVDSRDMLPGESFSYTFTAPGTFDYHCHPHPWMSARLTIEPATNGTAPQTHVVRLVEPSADTDTWGFEPEQLTIHVGDTVVWINDGSALHTVMGSTGIGGHHDHDHDHGPTSKKSPAALLVVPLLVAAALRRWD